MLFTPCCRQFNQQHGPLQQFAVDTQYAFEDSVVTSLTPGSAGALAVLGFLSVRKRRFRL